MLIRDVLEKELKEAKKAALDEVEHNGYCVINRCPSCLSFELCVEDEAEKISRVDLLQEAIDQFDRLEAGAKVGLSNDAWRRESCRN